MDIKGEQRIHATQEKVWEALNNPDILCLCLPGCESLEETDSNSFEAIIVTKIGPIKSWYLQPWGRFSGTLLRADGQPTRVDAFGVCEDHNAHW